MKDQRFIDLETKLSYQEVLIEELQKIVNDQYQSLKEMDKKIEALKERLNTNASIPIHEKPPHY